MAISGHGLLLRISLLLGILAIAANARPGPCQTLIFFSTSSSYPIHQNPSFSLRIPSTISGRRSAPSFFFTEARDVDAIPMIFVDRPNIDEEKPTLPFGFDSFVGSSIRDRTKDILSIVGSLLFGVGCGVLTAATLYLIWSLFAPNRFEFCDSDYESDDDLKKVGYVAIPAADAPIPVAAAPPAKEVV